MSKDHASIITCARFLKIDSDNIRFDFDSRKWTSEPDYVNVKKSEDGICSSKIGNDPDHKGQNLYLAPYCILNKEEKASGLILHEFIHAWGFYHEHSRPDRNKYITVYKEHMNESNWGAFEIINVDAKTFGLPFDYGSIMHYYSWSHFGNNSYNIESKVMK